jgi:hypothetical protein
MRQAFSTIEMKRLRSSASPIAEPPPTGGQTGATIEPMARFLEPTVSASFFRSSSLASMLVCGSARNRSMPSNFTPSTSAAAVMSISAESAIGGSASPPLPTTPGHMALCNFGQLLRSAISARPP